MVSRKQGFERSKSNSGSGVVHQRTPPSPGQEIGKNGKAKKIKTSGKNTSAQDLKQSEEACSLILGRERAFSLCFRS